MSETDNTSELPEELWGLRTEKGQWLQAIDEVGDPILAFRSQDQAMLGANNMWLMYAIKSSPIQIH